MKVIFLGNPEFAVECLHALTESSHEVVGVVTRPDKPGNRKKLTRSEVAEYAEARGLPVIKTDDISADIDLLKRFCADIFVTAAFGQKLSEEILSLPEYGVLNVHASLLPQLRGASPIQTAIACGLKRTGVSIMKTVYEMDAGDVLKQFAVDITPSMTADELSELLAREGGRLLVESLDEIERGEAKYVPQKNIRTDGARWRVSCCRKIKKQDERIDWSECGKGVSCKIRSLSSNPGARSTINGADVKIYRAEYAGAARKRNLVPGEIAEAGKNGLIVKCGRGCVRIDDIQFAGGKKTRASDLLNGRKIKVGDIFGDEIK